MEFCGTGVDFTDGTLSECVVDIATSSLHTLFLIVAIIIIVVLYVRGGAQADPASWVLFAGHRLRSTLTISLLALNLLELTEGILSDLLSQGVHLHLFIPHALAVLATAISLVFTHSAENFNRPGYLLLLFFYWAVSIATKGTKVFTLVEKGLGVVHIRLDLEIAVLVVYALLLIVEIYSLREQVGCEATMGDCYVTMLHSTYQWGIYAIVG